jgi:hypothetical protein
MIMGCEGCRKRREEMKQKEIERLHKINQIGNDLIKKIAREQEMENKNVEENKDKMA